MLSDPESGSSGPDHDPDFDPEVTVADPAAATRRRTRAGATTRTRDGIQNSCIVEFVVSLNMQIAYRVTLVVWHGLASCVSAKPPGSPCITSSNI